MTSKQRAYLKSIAMTTEPILQIGKSSLTPENTKAIDEALAARELISLIERPKTTIIEQVIVPGKVVEGKSVAQIPTDK